MKTISFRVIGTPKPQPRQRSYVVRGKNGKPVLSKDGQPIVRAFDPSTAEGWKSEVALAARTLIPDSPISGPVELRIEFIMPRPKVLTRKKDPDGRIPHDRKRDDVENLAKGTMDCLTTLGFWEDDGQVWALFITKEFCAKSGERPGAEILITWDEGAQVSPKEDALFT